MKKSFEIVLIIIAVIILLGLEFLIYQQEIAKNETNSIQDIKTSAGSNEELSEISFYGKVIESKQNYIIVEPNEDEEIRKTADKISINLGEENDAIYTIGTNLKITYTGSIRETYPVQIDVINIELKSVDNFKIKFYDKHPQNYTKINKILDKSETDKYNYNIYTYDGSANIVIKNQEMSLRNALLENKITMNEIIAQANQDEKDGKIKTFMYRDGGSIVYKYEQYTIIKLHKVLNNNEYNKDVYIGNTQFDINDITE